MKYIALAILTGFVSLSFFSFFGMLNSSDMAHASNKCLASLVQNGVCPPPQHTLASAIFHTNALKVFGTALLPFVIVLASLMLLSAGFVGMFLREGLYRARTLTERIGEVILPYLALQKLRVALVRLENSPTSL